MRLLRGLLPIIAGMLLATGTVVFVPTRADAVAGCPNFGSHCYGIGRFGSGMGTPVYMNGVSTELSVDCLWVDNTGTDFVNHEMWMSTNDNNPDPNNPTWVEEGMTDGTLWASPGQEFGFIWFWADQRPGGSYNEHYIGPASTGTYTSASFYWVPNTGNWDLYNNGSYVGTSVNVGAWAGGSDNGAESTTPAMGMVGYSRNWQYVDTSNSWQPILDPVFYNNSKGLLAGYTLGQSVYVETSNGCSGTAPAMSHATQTKPSTDTLVASVRKVAAMLGESNPTRLRYVNTTRHAGNAALGASVSTDQPVYQLQAVGNFTLPSQRVRSGKVGARGTNLNITVDAESGQVLDWGISEKSVDLTDLGLITDIR